MLFIHNQIDAQAHLLPLTITSPAFWNKTTESLIRVSTLKIPELSPSQRVQAYVSDKTLLWASFRKQEPHKQKIHLKGEFSAHLVLHTFDSQTAKAEMTFCKASWVFLMCLFVCLQFILWHFTYALQMTTTNHINNGTSCNSRLPFSLSPNKFHPLNLKHRKEPHSHFGRSYRDIQSREFAICFYNSINILKMPGKDINFSARL